MDKKIIACIGDTKITGIRDLRLVKKKIARIITSRKYYSKDNIYMSGLNLGTDLYFAEFILYLNLELHVVLSRSKQKEMYGEGDRARFNRIIRAAHSTYETFSIPEYRIKKKKKKEYESEFGPGYYIRMLFHQSQRFVIDMSDKVICIWNGKRIGSNTYRSLNYMKEKDMDPHMVYIGSRLIQ